MTDTKGLRVFISYSHGDEEDRVELETHLKLLQRQGVLSVWQDRYIKAGDEFDNIIAKALEAADIVLLLVSAKFLASDYCYEIEMKRAMERHEAADAKVIPIIIKHCDNWQSAPFGKLAAAPTDGKPIEDFSSRDKAFTDVARLIRKAATELRVKREAKLAPQVHEPASGPASGWHLPHARNVNFTGRAELLDQLHQELSSGEPAALVQALSGLGGIGKSQTAIEYAYRHKDDYRLVWWLRAEEPAALAADYASMAPALGLDVSDDQSQAIAAVRDRLDQMDGWLLIFDNAQDADGVRQYLPLQRRGRVIITSRNPNWSGMAKPVRVEVMGEEDAVALLLRYRDPDEAGIAKELAEALGFLPLALAQARAYSEHVGCTLRYYLDLLKMREAELLAQPQKPEDYDVPVAAAWDLAFETIQDTPGAADLLNLLAYLAPDAFPKNLLSEHADELQDEFAAVCRDPFKLDEAVAALRLASLVEVTDDAFSIHRLVQAIARDRCRTTNTEPGVAGTAIRLVNVALPDEATDYRTWAVYSILLAHALTAAQYGKQLDVELSGCSRLFDRIATYHQWRAAYSRAEALFLDAIEIAEKTLDPKHPDLATRLNNLAVLHREQGRYDEALPLYKRAIEIGEKTLGPDHPDLATRLNNLANLHSDQGRYDEALPLYKRALSITEKAFGPDHPALAIRLNNLANLHHNQGRSEEALPLFKRAIEIGEKTLGPEHPSLAIRLNNLANLHHNQGRYDEALLLYQRDIAITEKALGPDHPDLAISLNNLANLHHNQGRYDEALPLYKRAIEIGEKTLGPDHPALAIRLNNLAGLHSNQERYDEALPLFQRALSIFEAALPPEHPHTKVARDHYESCLRDADEASS